MHPDFGILGNRLGLGLIPSDILTFKNLRTFLYIKKSAHTTHLYNNPIYILVLRHVLYVGFRHCLKTARDSSVCRW